MNISETYDYLVHTRRQLWAALEAAPDELLSRPLAGEDWFPCLKDLVFHMATVEDGWLNMDILRREPVLEQFPALRDAGEGAACGFTLASLLEYWKAVEACTLDYLPTLDHAGLEQVVKPEDWRGLPFTVDGLLGHVMIHEMRHSAQIVVLLRQQGIVPPALDVLFYLADREIKKLGGEGL
jgi:uncharacterized damage-inducible protein DinB